VEEALRNGVDVVFDIDWQGHQQLRAALPDDVVGVFILPPTLDLLEARLRARAGDDVGEIGRRMSLARDEIGHWREFSHVIVNDDLEQAIAAVLAVLRAARLATSRQAGLGGFIAGL
jgi:guanylate kinase